MKKKYLFSMAAAAMMMAACSSEDVVAPATGGGAEWNAEGQGYISLAINLPTQPAVMKAFSGSEVFDDGTPEEYDVQDATLIIFKGTDEASAKIQAAYDLDANFTNEGASDQITTTSKIVRQIQEIEGTETDNLYALVVLNRNGAFTVGENGAITVGGNTAIDMTLAAFNDAVIGAMGTSATWHANGFLMSNAPLSSVGGGDAAPAGAVATTLTEFDATKIHSTEIEASNDVAANIYVERAVAKVTVSGVTEGDVENLDNVSYTVEGWQLDNYNTTSNLVREVANFNTWAAYTSQYCTPAAYRFVGGSAVGTTIVNTNLYRTYWGEDVNYADAATQGQLVNLAGQTADCETAADGAAAEYCFENTSSLAQMLENQMTRVIVKATLSDADFYVINGDKEVMYTEEQAINAVLSVLTTGVEGTRWLRDNLRPVQEGEDPNVAEASDFEVTLAPQTVGATAGLQQVASIAIAEAAQSKYNEGVTAVAPEVVAAINGDITIDLYEGGAAYYPVYVAHFGEGETPWTEPIAATDPVYPGDDANFLGRWGMLRNNWYDIEITGIKGIGSSTVPPVTGETIDKLESYIGVQINILSWARRAQSVEL